ncbi:MAG: non-heme iron oxygenase ferredoxin subunit [Nocardioides sp.]|nr:non-heme iron oxygenase ferredoxin subunit [Nocardioides sp.]
MTFARACALGDIREDEALGVIVDGQEVALARHGDEIFAFEDVCSHGAVALAGGEVVDCTVECWLHGSRFDLRTGKPTGLPATEPVATFPIDLRGDDVFVDIQSTLNGVTPA